MTILGFSTIMNLWNNNSLNVTLDGVLNEMENHIGTGGTGEIDESLKLFILPFNSYY